MDAEYISRSEHAEFCKRVDAEDERRNKRLELLEENTKQINSLTTSVEKLAWGNVEAGDGICAYDRDWPCNRIFL